MTEWDDALSGLHDACVDTFGVPSVYTPSLDRIDLGGVPVDINGIFDESSVDYRLDDQLHLDAVLPRPVFDLKISDLGFNPMADDSITIGGKNFRVLEVQPDGKGMAKLLLKRILDPFAAM
ncbi:MAG: hypothetical protein HQL74_12555 [Magnetococcales bacterium]|nr:hypothetical protein [Magnetococcales bacterium]